MTTIDLAYGKGQLPLELDNQQYDVLCIEPQNHPPLPDPRKAFGEAVARPIGGTPALDQLVAASGVERPRVVIVVADHTRPVPDRLLVPWIVETLGVSDSQVTVIVGTGTHRASTREELVRMLGEETLDRLEIVNHDCQAGDDLVYVGDSPCHGRCLLNRRYVEADIRIATGFIEPHFFAGFSGGSKSVMPGIAGLETVLHFHRAKLIAHPATTWGLLDGNPLQKLTREMVSLCPPQFIVNVTLNLDKEITGFVAGDVIAAHEVGCQQATKEACVEVDRTYPVVVTTNSGYPLDQNFYQTVKGISAAARIVEEGGTIVVASQCSQGLPNDGTLREILAEPIESHELLDQLLQSDVTRHDQWQVQTLLQIARRADIVLYSDLSPEDARLTRVKTTTDLQATMQKLYAKCGEPRLPVAVLPAGPLTIPILQTGIA